MAFHISNFGSCGEVLRKYADIDGYIPEDGDDPSILNYGHNEFTEDFDGDYEGYEGCAADTWSTFLDEAVTATHKAVDTITAWRGLSGLKEIN